MSLFAQKKSKSKFFLLLDIASSSITSSIVHYDGTKKPIVFLTVKREFSPHSSHSFESHLSEMKKALSFVIRETHKNSEVAPVEAIVSIGSPWHMSQTRTAVMRRTSPFIVKKDIIKSFKSKEEKRFLDESKVVFGKSDDKISLLESKIQNTLVNGYSIIDPLGQKALSLSLTMYLAACPVKVTESVEEIILESIHIKKISFTTFQFMTFATLRDMSPVESNFLIIDISGEITDITLVKKDMLLESVSMPLGTNFFKNRMMKFFNWTSGEYKSRMSLGGAGKLSIHSRIELEEHIDHLLKEWSIYFRRAIHELGGGKLIPEISYIVGPETIIQYIKKLLESGEFQHFTETQNPIHATLIHNAKIHGLCVSQDRKALDPTIALLGHYSGRISK